MRIGYFGGSFDPPHRGHLTVARAARDRFHLDQVLLAPTGRQPLKPTGPEASFADRLRMTELLCAGHSGLQASAIDAPLPDGSPNYTADTLRRLHAELAPPPAAPGRLPQSAAPQIFAIVGADAFLTLPQWHDAPALFDLADWIVVSRPGFPLTLLAQLPLTPAQRSRVHLLKGPADPTTATILRTRLHTGQPCTDHLVPEIVAYIRENDLYM